MINYFVFRYPVVVIFATLVLINGCARTQPSRLYLLHSLPGGATEGEIAAGEHGVSIGIGPVKIPKYLDRPEIMTRTSLNELQLAEFSRWAEPLKDNITQVLAENLAILLSTDRVSVFPWRRATPMEYQVAVEVIRFDGEPGRNTSLIARWILYGKNGEKALLMRKSSISEPVGSQDYETLVSAKSRMLAELSREIAGAITFISKETHKLEGDMGGHQ